MISAALTLFRRHAPGALPFVLPAGVAVCGCVDLLLEAVPDMMDYKILFGWKLVRYLMGSFGIAAAAIINLRGEDLWHKRETEHAQIIPLGAEEQRTSTPSSSFALLNKPPPIYTGHLPFSSRNGSLTGLRSGVSTNVRGSVAVPSGSGGNVPSPISMPRTSIAPSEASGIQTPAAQDTPLATAGGIEPCTMRAQQTAATRMMLSDRRLVKNIVAELAKEMQRSNNELMREMLHAVVEQRQGVSSGGVQSYKTTAFAASPQPSSSALASPAPGLHECTMRVDSSPEPDEFLQKLAIRPQPMQCEVSPQTSTRRIESLSDPSIRGPARTASLPVQPTVVPPSSTEPVRVLRRRPSALVTGAKKEDEQ